MGQDKPAFRAPFFRDLYKTLLTISSGSVIAAVTFAQNLDQSRSVSVFFVGFFLLVASIILQLLIPLLNVIGAGFYWNGEVNQSDEDSQQAHFWGKAAGAFIFISTFFSMVGIVLICVFVGKNID